MPGASAVSTTRIVIAFALLYVIWGSTYLAIGIAVTTIPPLTMAAVRFLVSGLILHLYCRLRGEPPLTPAQWGAAALLGLLLLLLGNGLVCVAERTIPSGIAALVICMTPLWMTLLSWLTGQSAAPRSWAWLGILCGIGGVAGLMLSRGHQAAALDYRGLGCLLLASLAWSVGSVCSRLLPAPASPLLASAGQMWCGGILLLIAAVALGETDSWHHLPSHVGPAAAWALLYLTVVGSLLGYGSYVFLLRHVPSGLVSTYAFVNPVIAVLLGWLVNQEVITARMLIAGGVIVLGVVLMVLAGNRPVAVQRRSGSQSQLRRPTR